MTAPTDLSRLTLGTAPDSWGVWFPEDAHQVTWRQYLDELPQAGYVWTELGPQGFLPQDPAQLRDELDRRGLKVCGGTVFASLHQGKEALDKAKEEFGREARLLREVGAKYLVHLPTQYTDMHTGESTEGADLGQDDWTSLVQGTNELARYLLEEFGIELVFHPHVDTHVDTQERIERFLSDTDPQYVNLCLDTGHIAYCHGDNVQIVERVPGSDHLRAPQAGRPGRARPRARREAAAVRGRSNGARWSSRPTANPPMPRSSTPWPKLDRDVFCVIEQDLYPVAPDVPLPIAARTAGYFAALRGRAPARPLALLTRSGRIVMTLNVGVIGVGMIGQDHIRRLTHVLSGAQVTAVTDVDLDRAKSVAAALPAAKALQTGQELIADSEVDAVVVASWGPTHEEYVLACIEAGKQVFCEKPLATTREACERILDAETAAGKRLVMVGFMRRYDDAYRAMKAALNDGQIGAPLLYYSGHRNPAVPPSVTTDGVLVDTCVHDIDTSRWLFDAEVVSAEVRSPRRSSLAAEHLQDPILLLLELSNGMLVSIEAAVNIAYGYDIRGEVLGETGTIELAESGPIVVKREGGFGGRVPSDWRERFIRAYDIEFQEWIDAAAAGRSTGPSSWDGYAATVVCDAAVEANRSGRRRRCGCASGRTSTATPTARRTPTDGSTPWSRSRSTPRCTTRTTRWPTRCARPPSWATSTWSSPRGRTGSSGTATPRPTTTPSPRCARRAGRPGCRC